MTLTINGMVLTNGISCAGELLVEFVQHLAANVFTLLQLSQTQLTIGCK